MPDEIEEQVTATGTMSVGRPKFQAAVPYDVRRILGINDLDDDEEAIVQAEFELKKIEKNNS